MSRYLALTTLLVFISLYPVHATETDTTATISQSVAMLDSVVASGKFIEKLDSASFYNLPIGILGGSNKNPDYAILIDEVAIY